MKDAAPNGTDIVGEPKFRRFITGSGRGFWLTCDRPFADAATDLFRSAIRACKPVPSVYGNYAYTPKTKRVTTIT